MRNGNQTQSEGREFLREHLIVTVIGREETGFKVGQSAKMRQDFNAVVGRIVEVHDDYLVLDDRYDLFGKLDGLARAPRWACERFDGEPRMLNLSDVFGRNGGRK